MNLEYRIRQEAEKILPIARETVERYKKETDLTKVLQVEIPFFCEGVVDSLIYCVSMDKFIGIKYSIGVGDGVFIGHQESGYYDDIELKTITI